MYVHDSTDDDHFYRKLKHVLPFYHFVYFHFSQEMAEILNHDRVYGFLHIPVQSASNGVLNDMKREYTVQDFKHIADFLRAR